MSPTEKSRITFSSAGVECVAWHYPGTNGACVVMAGGFALPKEPATDMFAQRFQEAGFSVVAFDYRNLGESAGEPRLVLSMSRMRADWDAAIAAAAELPGVDPARLAVWGFSATAGLLFEVAATDRGVAAAIMQTPNMGGVATLRNAASYQAASAKLRLFGRAIRDVARGLAGRPPLLVPLVGPRGSVAMLSTPDGFAGPRALRAERYPAWEQAVAARSIVGLMRYRASRFAPGVTCPALLLVCDDDQTALPGPAIAAAERLARGEVFRMPGGHYEPFLTGHDPAVAREIAFLRGALVAGSDTNDASASVAG